MNTEMFFSRAVAILVLVDYPFGGRFADNRGYKIQSRNPCSSGLSFRRGCIGERFLINQGVAILVLVDYPFGDL